MPSAPGELPVLSAGKHRSPRSGACFMEFASFLAGERWSDHPSCTHPLVAEVARNVNDRISDEARPQLAVLVPEVIGLVTDDPRADARIALHCALLALPVADPQRQGALAVALRSAERALGALGDPIPYEVAVRVQRALEQAPHAAAWADRFARRAIGPRHATSVDRFRRQAAPEIVQLAARGVEDAGGARDQLLHRLLEVAVEQCRPLVPQPAVAARPVDAVRWREACALTV
jgi:hypothetical protein